MAALDVVQFDLDAFGTAPPAPPASDAQREAVFHRADLLASLAEYAAAESALQLEVARQYPDIHLGPGYTYDTGTNKIGFGLAGITLPVFDQNQGGIAQAEAKRKEAAARLALGNEAWKVRAQVRDALILLYTAQQRAAFLSRKAEAQRQVVAPERTTRRVRLPILTPSSPHSRQPARSRTQCNAPSHWRPSTPP